MGQIIGSAAKPKRCNLNRLSQVPTPAAGEHILVSSDNSMNAAGQGNFDYYIVGDGTTAATALPLHTIASNEIGLLEMNAATSSAVHRFVNPLKIAMQDLGGDTLYIADNEGNVVAKIDASGIHAIEVEAQGYKLSEIEKIDNILDWYSDALYVTDMNGNVIMKVDAQGVHSINGKENQWAGLKMATYGDSITALNGGDVSAPISEENTNAKWSLKVARYFLFNKLFNRGIGSTTMAYRAHGGQVSWVNTITGEYVGRDDNYNYDNYSGHVTIPTGCTAIRSDGCSWLRITSMFPASIKDTINVVLIQFHNDYHQDMATDAAWVDNDTTDPEWAASSYYSSFGGDYNISSVKGGIASMIMKLQAWMPNALLVLMTPISGVYINGNENVKDLENVESAKMKTLAEVVEDIAFRMSIECIDVYGTDGINSLNHSQFITDGIHPYNDAGCKKIARAVISGLNPIVPNL